jgi:hypothetical protein
MATRSSAHCPVCREQRLIERATANNLLHLVLTVLTCGLWLIVWFFRGTAAETATWRCTVCGTSLASGLLQRPVAVAAQPAQPEVDAAATRDWLQKLGELHREQKVTTSEFERLRAEALNP